ncbi:MAG: hypothetical protein O7G88_11820 [bacterium]|nr:hypothetical protein [bacterium]
MIYQGERRLRINASADMVWQWMSDVRHLLRLNVFHTDVPFSEPVMQAGLRVPIRHNICGLYRRTRIARIRIYRKYFVAWSELQEQGRDYFPHSQSFTIVPIDAQSCLIVNHLRGKFFMPGARYWFLPFYRIIAARLLDHENRQIALAVAALQAATINLRRKDSHGNI